MVTRREKVVNTVNISFCERIPIKNSCSRAVPSPFFFYPESDDSRAGAKSEDGRGWLIVPLDILSLASTVEKSDGKSNNVNDEKRDPNKHKIVNWI